MCNSLDHYYSSIGQTTRTDTSLYSLALGTRVPFKAGIRI